MYAGLGNSGYDVDHYALDLDFDGERLAGTATLTLHPTKPLSSFYLDFTGLSVMSVTVDGETAGFETSDELLVRPLRPLTEDRAVVVVVEYQGAPASIPNVAGRFRVGWHKSVDGWFALSEPAGAETWFPSNNHPLDKATFSLRITVPAGLVAVSSGVLREQNETAGGSTFVWESDDPIAPYLVALAIGDLERRTSISGEGVSIVNYFDDDIGPADRLIFDRQGEMIDFFAGLFGPYPFDEYGAVVLETANVSAALETQTRATFGTQILALGEPVVAHELAHQWFGDSVSVADWSDVWLNEGFATYAEWMWTGHSRGAAALAGEVESAYRTLSGAALVESTGSAVAAYEQALVAYPPPGTPQPTDLFNASVYIRGGLALHVLRMELGDQRFFAVLQNWATTHRYGNASTNQFLDLVETVGGPAARQLMEQWLFSPALPSIDGLDLHPPS
jgi:aminopeptidase N